MKKSIFFSVLMLGALVLVGCQTVTNETPATTATELWPAFDSQVGLYGFINRKGEWAIPAQFTNASTYFSNGVAQVSLNGKNVFIDKSGKIRSSVSFDSAEEFCYGYARAKFNDKWGLLNSSLEFAIDPVYAALGNMTSDGLVTFQADAKHYGFLDKNGVIKMKDKKPVYFERAADFRDGYCVVCKDASRTDAKGNERIPTYCLIDPKFNEVIADGAYMAMANMGKGFVAVRRYTKDLTAKEEYEIISAKDQKSLTSTKYTAAGVFSKDGFAVVGTGEYPTISYGVIDTKGTAVVPVSLDELDNIYDGYVWGRQNNEGFLIKLPDNTRAYTLLNKNDEYERPMTGVHNGLVLIKKISIDKNYDEEVEYSWIDVKNGNKVVFSWEYDKDSKYQGDLNPGFAPARK